MASFFSWLDHSEQERRRMMDIISSIRERETRDELGVGSIRDAFADIFFPGTSTIQTRVKYFLFIPWIYLRLEANNVQLEDIERKARKEEMRLIDGLIKGGEEEGVIGSDAREKLQRLPSNIYWNGLAEWGIRLFRGSQYSYHRFLGRHRTLISKGQLNDDKEPADPLSRGSWHYGIPKPSSEFPDRCSFQLSREEAGYLRERLFYKHQRTLLAFLVEQGKPSDAVGFPWRHPQYASFPDELKSLLRHARYFSETFFGAPLLYNLMLAELAKNKERAEEYREKLISWANQDIKGNFDDLIVWRTNLTTFWGAIPGTFNIRESTRSFVSKWLDIALKKDPKASIADNQEARGLILDRERRLKGSLARLDNQAARARWSGASGTGRLDYRWGIAQRHINDILNGLKGDSNA